MPKFSPLCKERESWGLPMRRHTIVMVDGLRRPWRRRLHAVARPPTRVNRAGQNARRRRLGRLVGLAASRILVRRPLGLLILHEPRELAQVLYPHPPLFLPLNLH